MTFEAKIINNKTNTQLLLNYLETSISDGMIFNSFVREINIIDDLGGTIILETPSEAVKFILERDYIEAVESAAKEVLERNVDVKLVIKGTYIPESNDGSESSVNQNKKPTLAESNVIEKYNLDNYVGCKFNSKALRGAKAIIEEQGVFSPLFIYSSSGLGKTHLLHAIGNEVIKKGKTALFINPDRLTYKLTKAMKKSQEAINEITDKITQFDYIMFDDIQNLGNRTKTLSILFNIINTATEKGTQIIFAADKTPNELGGFEDRFITRFEKGLTLEIKTPSINDLIEILKQKLDIENLNSAKWESQALSFIARNYSNSIRSIEGAVKRVKFFTMDNQSIKYTQAVVSKIFDQLKINKEELTPQRIISTVSHYYKISKTDIYGKTRKKNVVQARHIAMWLIRSLKQLSYAQIGEIFGGRDHSTTMSAISKIETSMRINSAVKLAIKQIESKITKVS
ncbi:chromosomal replication initiator protein DnaA [Mycoplasma marinum]|uniref:Chromosomal replication initiator protein DnaA n=1 Tax=Mycoplasma marinum TaxID=1937190 RepID=A0A4R0XQL6_9MOLU|nr:chromosomal replication initiator protein DnaA [Mycoplasma marinum]TCG10640.1 chromosomal replication initiator protein DnaA [Mycoplasma marinum]